MLKVVIVDDEHLIRISIKKRIGWDKLGLVVIGEADNGQSALSLIDETKPDIVLADIRMPVMNGLELIKEVRDRGDKDTQFIILSGYNDFQYMREAIKLGVCDYIQKPIDENELESTLAQIIKRLEKERSNIERLQSIKNKADIEEPGASQIQYAEMYLGKNNFDNGDTVRKVMNYIDKNFQKDLTLIDLALYCHMNPSYISQLFKQKTGVNITRYIENVRIEKSKVLLSMMELSVIDVALHVGYNDANYFSKVFKKNTGLSPTQYQQMHTKSIAAL